MLAICIIVQFNLTCLFVSFQGLFIHFILWFFIWFILRYMTDGEVETLVFSRMLQIATVRKNIKNI